MSDSTRHSKKNLLLLFVVSIAALFHELLLIRWIGTEINIFAYLQNIVLVVCFLGLGIGCFTSGRAFKVRQILLPLLTLVVLLAVPVTKDFLQQISTLLSVFADPVSWNQMHPTSTGEAAALVLFGLLLTFIVMHLVLTSFIPYGRVLGRILDEHPNTITAYSVNVVGSLLGIWLFVGLSFLQSPPFVWFLSLAILLFILVTFLDRTDISVCAFLMVVTVLSSASPLITSGSTKTLWSPYQKLTLKGPGQPDWVLDTHEILVNNSGYFRLIDLSTNRLEKSDNPLPDHIGFSQYDIPYLLHPNPQQVLILGAGGGNDAAGAVRAGAERITAVEIDPAIIQIGLQHHPEKPYGRSDVTTVIDDARSFIAYTSEKYDVISLGLLDSHTMTSMTNARLDHYVYTYESLQHMKKLLRENGLISLAFEARKQHIIDRISEMLTRLFGSPPLLFRVPFSFNGPGGVLFIAGNQQIIENQLNSNLKLQSLITQLKNDYPVESRKISQITTDDWPYFYLESRTIPTLFFLIAGMLVGLYFFVVRRLGLKVSPMRWESSEWHFFFLGAAFLLLEVQNISKASVVLGNTWSVNAVIISAILIFILLANLIASRFPSLPSIPIYALLLLSCIGLYFLDLSQFAFLPYSTKALIVGGLTTLPIFFAGIIFIRSFKLVEHKDRAFGANLFGSLAGGLLQSLTFLTGIKALLIAVSMLYFFALLTARGLKSEQQP